MFKMTEIFDSSEVYLMRTFNQLKKIYILIYASITQRIHKVPRIARKHATTGEDILQ